jgi:hypothetical protein
LDAAVTMHMEQEHGDADSHLAPSTSAPDLMDAMNRTDMFSTPNFMGMPMHPGMMAGMSTDQHTFILVMTMMMINMEIMMAEQHIEPEA